MGASHALCWLSGAVRSGAGGRRAAGTLFPQTLVLLAQVECNMSGAGARWSQVGTFPNLPQTFRNFGRDFPLWRMFETSEVSWKILLIDLKKTLCTLFCKIHKSTRLHFPSTGLLPKDTNRCVHPFCRSIARLCGNRPGGMSSGQGAPPACRVQVSP